MTTQDDLRFALALAGLAEIFNETISEPRLNAYREALKDLTIGQIEEAARRLMNACRFFPKPVEFREALGGSTLDRAELAWRTLVELVQFQGGYPSLFAADGPMAYAVECLGGWLTICEKLGNATPEMVAHYSKHFRSSYQLGVTREAQPQYFTGQFEVNNRSLGAWKAEAIDQPVVVAIPGEFKEYAMKLDVAAGRLTEECRQALYLGRETLARYLPASAAAPVAGLLPAHADGAEMATPEEVQEILDAIKRLAGKNVLRFPALTVADIEAEAALMDAEGALESRQVEQEDYALQGA